jgi:hypothetical protein
MIESTQSEKNGAIENILAKGLRKPQSLWSALSGIRQLLGFRFIFWDTAQALVLSAIILAATVLCILFSPEAFRVSVLFGCSPLLFIIIIFSTEAIERADSLYELKLTCKYTIRQITAFRIMCFSLLGVVFCVGVTEVQAENADEVLRLFPLSLCALFICAFISLFFIRRFAGKLTFVSAVVLWMVIASAPALIFGDKWERFLSGLPAAVTLGGAALFAALFLFEIRKLMNTRQREAAIYVIG